MTSRERVQRTLTFQKPDRIPRDLWMLGGIAKYHKAELDALNSRFPSDFAGTPVKYGESLRATPAEGTAGRR